MNTTPPTHSHGEYLCVARCQADQAAVHAYTAPRGSEPGVTAGPSQLDVISENGRRLIARWTPEGVWVGGCLIASQADAQALAAFITREGEDA